LHHPAGDTTILVDHFLLVSFVGQLSAHELWNQIIEAINNIANQDPTEHNHLCTFVMLGHSISVAQPPSSAVDHWNLITKQVGVDGQHLATCNAILSLYVKHNLVDLSGMPTEDSPTGATCQLFRPALFVMPPTLPHLTCTVFLQLWCRLAKSKEHKIHFLCCRSQRAQEKIGNLFSFGRTWSQGGVTFTFTVAVTFTGRRGPRKS
jgi:hypothetical protein